MRGALDYQGSDTAVIEAWALAFEPDNEILEYVASLGSRKAVFTNNGPMLDACLAGPLSRLAAVFDEIICSWHLRACKPDVLAFEQAAVRLGAQPERLLLLDDSPDNVAAARACGWDAECVSDLDGLKAAVVAVHAKR